MSRSKVPGATKELNELIVLQPSADGREDQIRSLRLMKLKLLLSHYRIATSDEDCWQQLALRLAVDTLRGFQVREAGPLRRRQKIWGLRKLDLLMVMKVEDARNDDKNGRGRARRLPIRELIPDVLEWLRQLSPKLTARSARVRYYKIRKQITQPLQALKDRPNLRDFLRSGPVRAFTSKAQLTNKLFVPK